MNEERALQLGLNPADIRQQVFICMEGTLASELKKDDIGIQVRYSEDHRQSLEDLQQLRLFSPLGIQVPLKQVAELKTVTGPDLVTRQNMQQTIDVLGYTYMRPFSHVMGDIEGNLQDIPLPDGYNIKITGEQSDLKASKQVLLLSLAVALIGVYLVLLIQFKSFIQPLTIMTAIPLVLIEVSMALLLGLILLAGSNLSLTQS